MNNFTSRAVGFVTRFFRAAGVMVIGLAVMFVLSRLLYPLMIWQLYGWFFQPLKRAFRFPDLITGAISIWVVTLIALVLPALLYTLFFRRLWKSAVIISTAVSVVMVAAYFLEQPRKGEYFTATEGKPLYKYAEVDGKIELFPLGYNYDPHTQSKLELVNWEVVKRHERQSQNVVNLVSPPAPAVEKKTDYSPKQYNIHFTDASNTAGISGMIADPDRIEEHDLVLRLESVAVTANSTTLLISARVAEGRRIAYLPNARVQYQQVQGGYMQRSAVLTGKDGISYAATEDSGMYEDRTNFGGYFTFSRAIMEPETYRFEIVFPRISYSPWFKFRHPGFSRSMTIYAH